MTAVADALGVPRQRLHALLAGRAALSPEMALRLGELCGPGIWLRTQEQHDPWRLERAKAAELARTPTLRAAEQGLLRSASWSGRDV